MKHWPNDKKTRELGEAIAAIVCAGGGQGIDYADIDVPIANVQAARNYAAWLVREWRSGRGSILN